MPYVNPSLRKALDPYINPLIHELLEWKRGDGEVNYVITKIINEVYNKDANYAKLNRAIGVLECVLLEFYRRVVVPYEISKLQENGDVYK